MKNYLCILFLFFFAISCNPPSTEQIMEEDLEEINEPKIINGLLLPAEFNLDTTTSFDAEKNINLSIVKPVTTNREFNQLITDSILFYQNDFVIDIVEFPGDDDPMENSFSIYPAEIHGGDTLSVSLVVDQYYAGAAHPYSQYFTVNYDTSSKKVLTFSDVFNFSASDSTHFLEKVNSKLGPSELLLQDVHELNFIFKGDSIIFYFDNYEVGPYAAGLPKAAFLQSEMLK